jgi:hypothetical protein
MGADNAGHSRAKLTTKGGHFRDDSNFGGLTIVRDCSVRTPADGILSNLKSGRDEQSLVGSNPAFRRPSSAQVTKLLFCSLSNFARHRL